MAPQRPRTPREAAYQLHYAIMPGHHASPSASRALCNMPSNCTKEGRRYASYCRHAFIISLYAAGAADGSSSLPLPEVTRKITLATVLPWYARHPLSISHMRMPKPHTSAESPASPSVRSSGAMCVTVPIMSALSTLPLHTRARPKSHTTAVNPRGSLSDRLSITFRPAYCITMTHCILRTSACRGLNGRATHAWTNLAVGNLHVRAHLTV
mmetsp:Transcript_41796/g.75068  ORF Transcript_41796/g.75068 Transcript_41796/m.75068 type:complete len:211 (+) Transcript_41796:231-863(+)